MENKKLVRIHLSDNLYTTANYDDVTWDAKGVVVKIAKGRFKIYHWNHIAGIEIFEA